MDAHKMTLSEIMAGNKKTFEIPFFQRAYVWDEDQWERLLSDIEEVCKGDQQYFVGSIILKQQESSLRIGEVRTVVDGQQRLTTLSILLKVLSLKSNNTSSNNTSNFDNMFRRSDGEIKIRHNYNDVEVYNSIMNLRELKSIEGKDKISRAYQYFLENADPKKINFDVIGDALIFVCIELAFNEDEQQIFDTINSLGVRLTTAELLKNYFFSRDEVNSYVKYWRDVFEKDDETKAYWDREITTGRIRRTYIDMFFFAFLQIKIQDSSLKVEDKQQFLKMDRLFDSYKQFIHVYLHDDKKSILEDLRAYAEEFRRSIDERMLDQELPATPGIERINALIFALDTTVLIPYVLLIEHNVADINERNGMYEYLESYIMRRLVTKETTKNYNKLFYENLILNHILTRQDLVKYLEGQEDKINSISSDEEVMEAFHKSKLTNKYATGVLYLIESRKRDKKFYSTQLLGIKKYSLEHMMPKKWRNNWPPIANERDAEERDEILLTLGNLTIITQPLNTSISDADWETKKNGKGNKGGLKKYTAGIETLYGALDLPEWNEETIKNRATKLAKAALDIWPEH